ncbi:hypothetical protein ACSQ67_000566 [Phaseolus vulgaris]
MPPKFDPLQVVDVFVHVTGGLEGPPRDGEAHRSNHRAKVMVLPSAAALVIKALKEPERDMKKNKNMKHNGNIAPEDVIEIARVMRSRSMAKDL